MIIGFLRSFENPFDFTELARRFGKVGGFAHLRTLVRRLREESGPGNSLLLDGGDTWQGSGTAYWTRGRDMVGAYAAEHGLPFVYVNQVGANDELVFDGHSLAFDASGRVVLRALDFAEDILFFDVPEVLGVAEETENVYRDMIRDSAGQILMRLQALK